MTGTQHPSQGRLSSDSTTLDVDNTGRATPSSPDVVDDKTPSPPSDPDHHNGVDPKAVGPSATPQGDTNTPHEPEAQRTKAETIVIMSALCVSLFLAALDSTIVTTAVPTITAHFGSSTGYVWIGSAYLLGNAAFIPTWGKVSDIFGRKPVILLAVSVFLIGSLLCAVSQSMGMLIAARAIQGVGSGGCIVLPNICISDLFSLRKRGMYFGILGMVWALASALGPILGGVFTEEVTWRWCFYINLPTGGVALAILFFFLKLHNPRTPIKAGLAAIDWIGNLLIVGATLMFLLGLEFGGVTYPWASATVICLIVFGLVTVVVFVFYEMHFAKFPVIPLRLFRLRTSVAAQSLAVMHASTFIGGSYWLPLYFQSVLAASSLLSGVYLLPFVLSLSFCSALAGVVIKKTGNYKLPINIGLFVSTLGFGLFTYLGDRPHWARVIIFQLIAGIGIGPNFQAPLIALQTNVEPRDIGGATSSFSFLRQIGTSISVTIGGTVFDNVMKNQQAKLATEIGPKLAAMFNGDSAAASVSMVRNLPAEAMQPVKSAYWQALQKMFIMYACFSFVGFLISFAVEQKTLSKQHTEHKTGLKSLRREKSRGEQPATDIEKGGSQNK